MIKLHYQIQGNGTLKPQSELDADTLFENYKLNQPVSVQITGGSSARSVPESNLFHSCCKLVAENTEDDQWNSTDKAKIQCKMLLKFFKEEIWVDDGGVHFVLDTLRFDKTNQVRSHKFIEQALDILARKIGLTREELVKEAKLKMGRGI